MVIKYCVTGIKEIDKFCVEVTSETPKTIIGLKVNGSGSSYGSPVRVRKVEVFDTSEEAQEEISKRLKYEGEARDYHKSTMPAKPKKQPSIQKTKKVLKIDTSHVKVFSDDDSGEIAF